MKGMKALRRGMALLLVLAVCMGAMLTGCANSNSGTPNNSTPSPAQSSTNPAQSGEKTTINIRVMNDVVNIDKVLAVYYQKVKDDPVLSNVDVNITYVTGADYADKLSLAVTAQEDYDLMFCGSWQGLDQYVQDGVFKDVTSYFNNDAYPGLKAAFSENLLAANAYDGKVMAIPLAGPADDMRGIVYNESLREKYECKEITDWETFEAYLATMKEHLDEEGLIAPWGVTAGQGLDQLIAANHLKARRHNILEYTIGPKFSVAISEDGKTVLGVATVGDEDAVFSDFPEGFQYNFIDEQYEEIQYWIENYCNTDCLTTQDDIPGMFEEGMFAATYSTLTEWVSRAGSMQTSHPDVKLGFFAFDDEVRACAPGAVPSDMKAWNMLVVPAWSEKTDEVMAFLDWMFGSQENHDLFELGIEGEDWEAIGDKAYNPLNADESSKYSMPAYAFTLNPNYVRYSSVVLENPAIEKLMDYQYSQEAYRLVPIRGFAFDNSNVEAEVATLSAIFSEFKGAWGAYGSGVTAEMKDLNEREKEAGLEKVREELRIQLQAFLDAQQ